MESPRSSPVIRAVRIGLGASLLAAGAAMLVLPGPGLLTIAAGLALLGREFGPVARLNERLMRRLRSARRVSPPDGGSTAGGGEGGHAPPKAPSGPSGRLPREGRKPQAGG